MRRTIALIILACIVGCSTPSSVAPLSIPLQYKTMISPGEFAALPACAAISKVQVEDTRDEKAIGKRFVEGKSSPAASVTASTDIAGWVRDGVESALKRAGVGSNAGGPILHVTIDQITTSENVLHRAGYEGRVILSAELRGANGQTCWKDRADGFAENYGYAGSVENYQETLNHALDRAVVRIPSAPEFKKSVCGCGSGH